MPLHAVTLGTAEVAGAGMRDQMLSEVQDAIQLRISVDGKAPSHLATHQKQGMAGLPRGLAQDVDMAA